MIYRVKTILVLLLLITFSWSQDCCEAADTATDNCGGLGCYIPQCIENNLGGSTSCEWEPMQCWSSTGYCWCVDENGVEIEGTSMPSWQGYPDCEEFNSQIGDVNGDDEINVIDIVLIVGFITEQNSPTDSEFLASDYNEDGVLNVIDIVLLIDLIINFGDSTIPEECLLEPDSGPCFGYVPMYYYNQDTQSCEMFIYGGCMGLVPFQSLPECQNLCE